MSAVQPTVSGGHAQPGGPCRQQTCCHWTTFVKNATKKIYPDCVNIAAVYVTTLTAGPTPSPGVQALAAYNLLTDTYLLSR